MNRILMALCLGAFVAATAPAAMAASPAPMAKATKKPMMKKPMAKATKKPMMKASPSKM